MKISLECHRSRKALALFISFGWCAAGADLRAQVPDDSQSVATEDVAPVSPQPASALIREVSSLSPQQREALLLRKHAMREARAAAVKSRAPNPGAPSLDNMPETQLAAMVDFPGNPGDLVLGRTGQPPESSNPSTGSTLAEPVGANVGDQWYVAGNSA